MSYRRSPLSRHLPKMTKRHPQPLGRGWRRALCFLLICGLLMLPDVGYAVSAASSLAVRVAKDTVIPVPVAIEWFKRMFRRSARPQSQDTLADRIAQVAHLQISPRQFVGYIGQSHDFSALPTNFDDQTIQGVKFSWESSSPDIVQIDDAGHARLLQPGLAKITCRAGNIKATAPVLVRPGQRPRQSDTEWRVDQNSLSDNTKTSGGSSGKAASLLPSLLDKLSPTAQAQSNWPDDFAYDELWSEPRNLVGAPRNRTIEATHLGSVLPEGSNFEFAVPIVRLGGRGLSTNLTLYYNSRVWTRRNNAVTFDAITGWPAPGFSLGFGRVVFQATGFGGDPPGKYILIDPDGTRHYLGSGTWAQTGYFQTSDGSHIAYVGNARYGGTLVYKDGSNATITPVNNRLTLPDGNTTRTDYLGSIVTITDQVNRKMKQESDGLGRLIKSNYRVSSTVRKIGTRSYTTSYDSNG